MSHVRFETSPAGCLVRRGGAGIPPPGEPNEEVVGFLSRPPLLTRRLHVKDAPEGMICRKRPIPPGDELPELIEEVIFDESLPRAADREGRHARRWRWVEDLKSGQSRGTDPGDRPSFRVAS
jgi:hypothetical protein